MLYSSIPDAAVFTTPGHTISTPLKLTPHGHLIVESTGERIEDTMRRSSSVSFFRDDEEMPEGAIAFEDCSF